MTDRAFVATRKGVFTITRKPTTGKWSIERVAFLGDNASIVSFDPRDGAIYVALGHGHFGVKMHRSDDAGETWTAIATPEYPPLPEGVEAEKDPYVEGGGKPMPTTLQLVWSIEPGGHPNELWCGTIPGALFHSADRRGSWRRVDALWNHADRKKWFGGGADWPGIHSICVHPRDPNHVSVGVSCGGMWVTRDGGESWTCKAAGMRAEYMPPERQFDPNIQDPHRIVQCPANPEAM